MVTPLAGVWIEMFKEMQSERKAQSFPLRECGLKCSKMTDAACDFCHSPCGSVD